MVTWAKIRSQTFNRLSHQGAPTIFFFFFFMNTCTGLVNQSVHLYCRFSLLVHGLMTTGLLIFFVLLTMKSLGQGRYLLQPHGSVQRANALRASLGWEWDGEFLDWVLKDPHGPWTSLQKFFCGRRVHKHPPIQWGNPDPNERVWELLSGAVVSNWGGSFFPRTFLAVSARVSGCHNLGALLAWDG